MNITRCMACNASVIDPELNACPFCKRDRTLVDTMMDVTARINWVELNILCAWAERWAMVLNDNGKPGATDLVHAIAQRLQAQNRQFAPLTMAGEAQRLSELGVSIELPRIILDDEPQ